MAVDLIGIFIHPRLLNWAGIFRRLQVKVGIDAIKVLVKDAVISDHPIGSSGTGATIANLHSLPYQSRYFRSLFLPPIPSRRANIPMGPTVNSMPIPKEAEMFTNPAIRIAFQQSWHWQTVLSAP